MEGDQKFIFDAKNKDSKNLGVLKKAKTAAMLPNYHATLKKTLNNIKEEQQNGLKTQKVNGVLSSSGHAVTKSPPATKAQETVTPHKNSSLSHLKSPPVPDASKVNQKKTEAKPVANGVLKSPQGEEKVVKERPKVKVKEEKDKGVRNKSESEHNESGKGTMLKSNTTSKSKPPKIQLPER